MILDKLMEVKDLKAFIKYRIQHLEKQKKNINKIEEKKREKVVKQINGRIKELRFLRKLIWKKNLIKEESKSYWRELNEWFN